VHWLYVLWFNYTWPSLKGNGPEAIVQTIVYAAAATLLIPPVRKWVVEHFKKLHARMDADKAELHNKVDTVLASHDELHAKLDHLITHTKGVPVFGGSDHGTKANQD
jgi:predicted lipoprotein